MACRAGQGRPQPPPPCGAGARSQQDTWHEGRIPTVGPALSWTPLGLPPARGRRERAGRQTLPSRPDGNGGPEGADGHTHLEDTLYSGDTCMLVRGTDVGLGAVPSARAQGLADLQGVSGGTLPYTHLTYAHQHEGTLRPPELPPAAQRHQPNLVGDRRDFGVVGLGPGCRTERSPVGSGFKF